MDTDPDATSDPALSSVTLRMQKIIYFLPIFLNNLPAGTLSSVLKIYFFAKIFVFKFYFASIISVRSTPL